MERVHRVKLYKLDTDGSWIDRGTGQISVSYLEQSEAMGLIVVAEDDDNKTLLVHKLSAEDIYQRQGEKTIISWSDKELATEVAVSFEKQAGCEQVWAQIKQAQDVAAGKDHHHEDEFDGRISEVTDFAYSEEATLPTPEISNLEELAKATYPTSPAHRDRVASAMLRPGWIPTLIDVFKQCEDLEDVSSLVHVFRILKGAIMLNDAALLEELLKEEFVMDVVGALEQDPELPAPQKHRNFLSTSVVFKEVVPIKDPALLAKIHQTYRIQYIKDVILPRSLDDSTYATLSSLALFNNVEVVSALAGDPDFLQHLFVALEAADPQGEEWADLVAFLQEFCNLARHLQQNARQQLFSKLVQLGLFEQVTRIMELGTETTKLRATDVLLAVMQHDTHALRTYMQQQKEHKLLALLVQELTESTHEGGLCEQVAELMKLLLDPETLKDKPERSEFCDIFYERFIAKFLNVIVSDKAVNPKEGTRTVPASTLGLIVDLMCFLVTNHAYRIKYFTVRNQLITKVLYVLRRPERWLACAAVRFLRTCVNTKDEFYVKHVLKNNLFEPVMTAFFQNGNRYNLLNSATLELIDFVTQNGMKDLMRHLVQQYSHRFEEVDYADTFTKLVTRLEQLEHQEQSKGFSAAEGVTLLGGEGGPLKNRTFTFDTNGEPAGSRMRGGLMPRRGGAHSWDGRGLSRDEEDYFEAEGEDEGGVSVGPGAIGLLDTPDLGQLPALEGPYPRPRRPVSGQDSPPGSPKRGRPVQFGGGPSAKRRAGVMPTLSIATPSSILQGGLQGQGEQAGQADAASSGGGGAAGWQGLTEYADEDDEEGGGKGQAGGGGGGEVGGGNSCVGQQQQQPASSQQQQEAGQAPALGTGQGGDGEGGKG